MRADWSQHVRLAEAVSAADASERGVALALMGVAMLMLAQDLLLQECPLAVMVP